LLLLSCGTGSTILAATQYEILATAPIWWTVRNFLTDTAIYTNIVADPPFTRAQEAIEYGLERQRHSGRIAILADLNFLSAQRRYQLHTRLEFEGLRVLMKRPSCPASSFLQARSDAATAALITAGLSINGVVPVESRAWHLRRPKGRRSTVLLGEC
jgi:hypothetical protein